MAGKAIGLALGVGLGAPGGRRRNRDHLRFDDPVPIAQAAGAPEQLQGIQWLGFAQRKLSCSTAVGSILATCSSRVDSSPATHSSRSRRV